MGYAFDRFRLDVEGGTLFGPSGHCTLPDKPFRLLCALVAAEGRVLGKEAAMDAVWPGQIVSDASLATALKAVRQALGDSGEAQRLVETVKGRGIRLAVPVIPEHRDTVAPSKPTPVAPHVAPPTLAVLRFEASSDALGRAIPADLISALSASRSYRLIARGTAFRFLSGATPPSELKTYCGADYVLSGEIAGDRRHWRVSIELADARSDTVVWTKEIALSDTDRDALSHALQQRLAPAIAHKISGHESARAISKATEDLSAWEAYHLGVTMVNHTYEGNLRALDYLGWAVTQDPNFSNAYAALSEVAFSMAFSHYTPDRQTYLRRTVEWADEALRLDPENALACAAKGRTFWLLNNPVEGLPYLDEALELDPNSVLATYSRGVLRNFLGDAGSAKRDLSVAMLASPQDPKIYSMRGHLGLASVQLGDYEAALEWAEHSVRSPRMEHMVYFVASVAASLAGESNRARHWKSELARVAPQITPAKFFVSVPLPRDTQTQLAQAFERID